MFAKTRRELVCDHVLQSVLFTNAAVQSTLVCFRGYNYGRSRYSPFSGVQYIRIRTAI